MYPPIYYLHDKKEKATDTFLFIVQAEVFSVMLLSDDNKCKVWQLLFPL